MIKYIYIYIYIYIYMCVCVYISHVIVSQIKISSLKDIK